MKKWAIYNEFDPHAAQWLRNLIATGHIAPGEVDERSIVDVRPDDYRDFCQVHLMAGIGGWSYALRQAGWPDERPVWTWSEPCQPFSAAGKGLGFADERYLRPHVHHLVSVLQPEFCFGEQVASKNGLAWLDVIQSDMEGEGYAFGAVDFCSAGVGAPHIRQRLYWAAHKLADSSSVGWERRGPSETLRREPLATTDRLRVADLLADTSSARFDGAFSGPEGDARDEARQRFVTEDSFALLLGQPDSAGRRQGFSTASPAGHGYSVEPAGFLSDLFGDAEPDDHGLVPDDFGADGTTLHPGPVNGLWADADWLYCTDKKWRPVEPGSFPLADGLSFKLGSGGAFEGKSRAKMLKGYGNAINVEQAKIFIEVAAECFFPDIDLIPD